MKKIYTKKGDAGLSYLFTGTRLPKNNTRFHALGHNDELSSHLGMAYIMANEKMKSQLHNIQCMIQDINAAIANPTNTAVFDPVQLEEWIDEMDTQIVPLAKFIIPSGTQLSCQLHVSRAVCRRAERAIFDIPHPNAGKYINRLSDYLFTAARFSNHLDSVEERIYK